MSTLPFTLIATTKLHLQNLVQKFIASTVRTRVIQEADDILIKREIHEFNLERALSNLNVDEQVTVFNRIILNTMKNFFPMKLLYAMIKIRR